MYRGWTQTDYQNKHYNINQKDEGTWDDRWRDGGANFILRINEQETRLSLQEHDDDDDDDDFNGLIKIVYISWINKELNLWINFNKIIINFRHLQVNDNRIDYKKQMWPKILR